MRFWRRKREEPKPEPEIVEEDTPAPPVLTAEEAAADTYEEPVVEAPPVVRDSVRRPAPIVPAYDQAEEEREVRQYTEQALVKTKTSRFGRIGNLLRRADFTEDLWDELEETLITSDTGMATTEEILNRVRERVEADRIRSGDQVRAILREELIAILEEPVHPPLPWETGDSSGPSVVLVVGVNGAGKTTTIGKLAHAYASDGASVVLAAGDTFRAAAIDQLKVWGDRSGVRVIAHQPNSDPGAVVHDAITSAINNRADLVIVDTAGRLHTKFNLMEELRKIRRIIERLVPEGPHATILVLDATTGQNGLQQARTFTEAAGVSGIALAKLDGTSRGGIVFAIAHEMNLPVLYIGTGEKLEDLAPFSATAFVDTLLD